MSKLVKEVQVSIADLATSKLPYGKPEIKIISVLSDSFLQLVSGQHNSIGNGGTTGDSKEGFFDFEEEEENIPTDANYWQ